MMFRIYPVWVRDPPTGVVPCNTATSPILLIANSSEYKQVWEIAQIVFRPYLPPHIDSIVAIAENASNSYFSKRMSAVNYIRQVNVWPVLAHARIGAFCR